MASTVRFKRTEIDFPVDALPHTLHGTAKVDFGYHLDHAEAVVRGVEAKTLNAYDVAADIYVQRVYYLIRDVSIVGGNNDEVRVEAELDLSDISHTGYKHTGKLWVVVMGVEDWSNH